MNDSDTGLWTLGLLPNLQGSHRTYDLAADSGPTYRSLRIQAAGMISTFFA